MKQRIKKVLVVDFLSKGNSHLNFNKSFLEALKQIGFNVSFLGAISHCKLIQLKEINKTSVKTNDLNWKTSVFRCFKTFVFSKKPNEIIIVCFDNYISISLLLLAYPFLFRKKFTLVFHNNLSSLIIGGFKSYPFKFFIKLYNPKILILSKNGFNQFNSLNLSKKVFLIPHMNYKHLYEPLEISKKETPFITISVIGRHCQTFMDQITSSVKLSAFDFIKFNIYKNIPTNKQYSNVKIHTKWLDNYELNKVLSESDFCFFGKQKDTLRASGILLDAVTSGCPIIAPNQAPFNELDINKIGYFYNSINELKEVFEKINTHKISRNYFQNNEFNYILEKTDINTFSITLKKTLNY